jgi:hypothetical protein
MEMMHAHAPDSAANLSRISSEITWSSLFAVIRGPKNVSPFSVQAQFELPSEDLLRISTRERLRR